MTRLSHELDRAVENQELQDELAALRATVKRLNRRTQQAEAALGEFRRIMDRPANEQGIRFVSGSIGRALLAWAWAKHEEEIATLKAEIDRLKEDAWMADACLNQVRDWLAAHGIDVEHTPPMYYPEACQSVLSKKIAESVKKENP